MTRKHPHSAPAYATQLLIAGGGPVGLCAALCAARRGLDVIVLEQSTRGYGVGYASVLHASSVALFEGLGIAAQLYARARSVDHLNLHRGGGATLRLALARPVWTVAQSALETILLKALREEGVEILAPYRVTAITQDSRRVVVQVEQRELVTIGSPAEYTEWQHVASLELVADFVLDADGYESQTRQALGIATTRAGATETFALFEGVGAGGELELAFSGELASIVVPLSHGAVRWGFQLDSELTLTPELAQLKALLARRAEWSAGAPERVAWGTVTHFERRMAASFGSGRVWLAGDAAHITGPFGCQSMNGGFREVAQLVGAIAESGAEPRAVETLAKLGAQTESEWRGLLGVEPVFEAAPAALDGAALAPRILPCLPASGSDLRVLMQQLGYNARAR